MAEWSTAFINDLPDSSFAIIDAGGTKDADGKTTPRSLRHFPYKDADGKIDAPHVRNGLARLNQADISTDDRATAKRVLVAAAKRLGIGEYSEPAADDNEATFELDEADEELLALVLAEGDDGKPKFVIGRLKGKSSTTVQTVIFPKSAFTQEQCAAWLERHDLSAGKVDETDDSFRYRQREPGDFEPGSFRTIMPGTKVANESVRASDESPGREFLSEYRRLILSRAKDGDLTDADLTDIYRKARGHAGGRARQRNRMIQDQHDTMTADLSEKALGEFCWGVELGEGKPIQIARTGSFTHPEYGEFEITRRDLAEMKKNFDANVRGQDLPIDVDHQHERGAVGWMRSLAIKGDTLWATPEWTDEGEAAVRDGKYRYFSPHYGPWEDPETGEKYRMVLMSGAVTNFPFLKNMEPLELSEVRKGGPMADDKEKELIEARSRAEALEKELAERDEAAKKATEEAKALTERVARMEHAEMVRRLTERVRGNGDPSKRLIGDEDQIVTFVTKLAETFGEESDEVKFAIEREETHSTALREAGVFAERGSGREGTPAAGAMGEIEKEVAKLMSERGISKVDATQKLLAERPELYDAANKETVRKK